MIDDKLTAEQARFVTHAAAAFVEACPGSGKTRAIVARLRQIATRLPPRKGVAVLSYTNSAVDEFEERCARAGLAELLKFPSFIGTFDAFVRHFLVLPSGINGVATRPIIVDSWSSLDIEVRLGHGHAFQGPGVDLDRFDPVNNQIAPEAIRHAGLQAHVRQHQARYVKAAASFRNGLRAKGYLSAADARVEALNKMQAREWASGLGRALAARFCEVIVDEAQDCNPHDIQILNWLRSCNLPVTIVCDPDQAIYGFRHGNPADLRTFSAQFGNGDRLPLTGNFRSSKPICALAATLRQRETPDDAAGENANVSNPVQIFVYRGRVPPAQIGVSFNQLIEAGGIAPQSTVVLAHRRSAALQAAGMTLADASDGTSRVAVLAKVVREFWSPSESNRSRETSLRTMERTILRFLDKLENNEPTARAAERCGISTRWLRRAALDFLTALPRVCPDTDDSRRRWMQALHAATNRLISSLPDGLTTPSGVTAKNFFRQPQDTKWSKHLSQPSACNFKCSTIHEAKGREYDAVCVVIPPDNAQTSYGSQLFNAWRTRADDEGKRVLYVGVTRAQKLLMLAVPEPFYDPLISILTKGNVSYRLTATPVTATKRRKRTKPEKETSQDRLPGL